MREGLLVNLHNVPKAVILRDMGIGGSGTGDDGFIDGDGHGRTSMEIFARYNTVDVFIGLELVVMSIGIVRTANNNTRPGTAYEKSSEVRGALGADAGRPARGDIAEEAMPHCNDASGDHIFVRIRPQQKRQPERAR